MGAWPHGDPDAVVRGILATAPYRHAPAVVAARSAPKKSAWEVFGDWFHDHVWAPFWSHFHNPIGHALNGLVNVSTPIGYGVVVLACLVLAFGIYRLAMALGRPEARSDSLRALPGLALGREASSAQLRARAAEAARSGDYARAIAALFAAALALLDERAVVAFDATRTPGEYGRLVRRANPGAAQPFGELSNRFVSAAYAERITTADDYAHAERAYAQFDPVAPGAAR
jgi:hypothetical protein